VSLLSIINIFVLLVRFSFAFLITFQLEHEKEPDKFNEGRKRKKKKQRNNKQTTKKREKNVRNEVKRKK
jgi:hypothetical protein